MSIAASPCRRTARRRRPVAARRQRPHPDAVRAADARRRRRVLEGIPGPGDPRSRCERSACISSTHRATTTPPPGLEKIQARVTWINSADDFVNPPELGIAEPAAKKIKNCALHLAARLRPNAWARHAHLGGGMAAVPERAARGDSAEIGKLDRRRARGAWAGRARPAAPGPAAPGPAASISSSSARRSLGSNGRERPRGRSRGNCTGPKRTRISRLTMKPRAPHQ